MSDFIVTRKETLVLIVDVPAHDNGVFKVPAWEGSLECSRQDWTIDQVLAHAGNPEHIVKVLRVGQHGEIENITDRILDYAEEMA